MECSNTFLLNHLSLRCEGPPGKVSIDRNSMETCWEYFNIAEDGFDPLTSGLWVQHAPAAPLCSQLWDSGLAHLWFTNQLFICKDTAHNNLTDAAESYMFFLTANVPKSRLTCLWLPKFFVHFLGFARHNYAMSSHQPMAMTVKWQWWDLNPYPGALNHHIGPLSPALSELHVPRFCTHSAGEECK